MVATQHKPVIGSAEYVDRSASPELQEELTRVDDALPTELRERFPVVARDDVKARFPDHWIALLPTHVDHRNRLVAGRLVTVAEDWSTFDAAVQSFRRDYPGFLPFTYFTGRFPMGRDVVRV
jgi:hypothetical protein